MHTHTCREIQTQRGSCTVAIAIALAAETTVGDAWHHVCPQRPAGCSRQTRLERPVATTPRHVDSWRQHRPDLVNTTAMMLIDEHCGTMACYCINPQGTSESILHTTPIQAMCSLQNGLHQQFHNNNNPPILQAAENLPPRRSTTRFGFLAVAQPIIVTRKL